MFKEKVVAITGASSGIGRALAQRLAREGAILALSDVNVQGLNETLRLLPPDSVAKSYVVDVSSRDAVFDYAAAVKRDFGAAHMVINNAGIAVFGTIANISIEEIDQVLRVNLWGVIYGTKAFLPIMLEQREGRIVNISSVFGFVGTPAQGAYHIAKFGVRGFTETLWQELEGSGVSAVCVHPGGIRTSIVESTRFAAHAGAFERMVLRAAEKLLTGSPEDCADGIVEGLKKGHPRILVGPGARMLHLISRLFPDSYGQILSKKMGFPFRQPSDK